MTTKKDLAGVALLSLHFVNDLCHPDGKMIFSPEEGASRMGAATTAAKLIAAARKLGIPVFSARLGYTPDHRDLTMNTPVFRRVKASGALVDGTWGAEFVDIVKPAPGEVFISQIRSNPFYGTYLESYLQLAGARELVLAGISTSGVIQGTTRYAIDLGYHITIAKDACAANTPAMHDASLLTLEAYASIQTSAEIIASWSGTP
jgi:nicotinamidase-related amidase